MSQSNFNFISKVYDWLSTFVFGNDIIQSQTVFLNHIKEGDMILVVGGGTGWILEEIDKLEKSVSVVYVEPSSKMLERSMKRVVSEKLKIQFIESRILDFQSNQQFDIICTFYFLDLFLKQELLQTIEKLEVLLKKSGKWLYADFYLDDKSPWQHRFVVKLMFIFFEIVANIQSHELFDLQLCIMKKGFTRLLHSKFKKGLIQSSVFGKG